MVEPSGIKNFSGPSEADALLEELDARALTFTTLIVANLGLIQTNHPGRGLF